MDLQWEQSLESMLTPKQYLAKVHACQLVADLISMEPRIRIPVFNAFKRGEKYGQEIFYRVTRDYIFLPGTAVPQVAHEIGHMVEMRNPARWVMNDWGMTHGGYPEEVSTRNFFTALSREIRVRAIQVVIKDVAAPVSFRIKEHPAWGESEWKKRLPFGKFQTPEQVNEWAEYLHHQTVKAWSEERIRHEWDIRLNYIRNHMESPVAQAA